MSELSLDDIKSIYYTVGLHSNAEIDIPNLMFKRRAGWKVSGMMRQQPSIHNDIKVYVEKACGCYMCLHASDKCVKCRDKFAHNKALARFDVNNPSCPVCKTPKSVRETSHNVLICNVCGAVSYVCWEDMITYVTIPLKLGTAEDII